MNEEDQWSNTTLMENVVFNDNDLTEQAKREFHFHDDIVKAFELNANIVLSNNRLSSIGRHLFCTALDQNYRNCTKVLNYVACHPEVRSNDNALPPILILCGAARTGSTLLYNLLACDPLSRAPTLLDMIDPIPPIHRSDDIGHKIKHENIRKTSSSLKNLGLEDTQRDQNASHPSYKYEEDVFILYQSGLFVPHLEPHDSHRLSDWFYDQNDKNFVYEYHKTFIQMLNYIDKPKSHWILKTPYHIFNIDTLLKYYPNALLIMTHRKMNDVLPSSIRLGLAYGNMYFDSNRDDAYIDRKTIIDRRIRATDRQIDRIVNFRRERPNINVYDISYEDLMSQPIQVVQNLYRRLGFTWTDVFEQELQHWLNENPQGKQGRNSYTLEEFNLTNEIIENKYETYHRLFFN